MEAVSHCVDLFQWYQLSKCFSEDGFWSILEHPCMLGCLLLDMLFMELLGMPLAAGEAGRMGLRMSHPGTGHTAAHQETPRMDVRSSCCFLAPDVSSGCPVCY